MRPGRSAVGKLPTSFLEQVVYKQLGQRRPEVSTGPQAGIDTSVIRLGHGRALVTTTDPLSLIPAIGARESAWMSAHLLASDIATSGLGPHYGIFDFNLPLSMTNPLFAEYWQSFHRACKQLGLAIIGGHTGRYVGCDYTIIGGGVMMSVGKEDQILTAAMGRSGDDLILTKGVAVEATAVLARTYPNHVKRALGPRLLESAWKYLQKVTIVEDALTAVTTGIHGKGVTAMHDATEGGVIAAALELARASGTGLILEPEQIDVTSETVEICKLFRINPMTSLSEGSLVLSSKPSASSKVIRVLSSKGIDAYVVGRLVPKSKGYLSIGKSTATRIRFPSSDPYWKAFETAKRLGWG